MPKKILVEWKVGTTCTVIYSVKLSKLNKDGMIDPGNMMEINPGDVGRIVGSEQIRNFIVYKVKFIDGIVRVSSSHLKILRDESVAINRKAMKKADPELRRADRSYFSTPNYE